MYYQQNGNYMQDLNYYNQNPNPNYAYNPYMSNGQNGAYVPQSSVNMGDMSGYSNGTMNMMNTPTQRMPQSQQNLNAMYPAVYRIISPVVSQVVANNNTNYLTEESLNSMVDSVYSIVEGDINVPEETSRDTVTENSTSSNCSREIPTTGTRRYYNKCFQYLYE